MNQPKTWQKLKTDPKLWKRYFIREQVLTAIRRFFFDQDFHEVETPFLTGSLPPESYLDIYETTIKNRLGGTRKAYLPTSPEPFLKKLLAAGIGNCFTITKSFRNGEDMSLTHNPEFTILEWYRTEADYEEIMRDCEDLVLFINTYLKRMQQTEKNRGGNPKQALLSTINYQGKIVDLSRPWKRLSVARAFSEYAGIDDVTLLDENKLLRAARAKGYKVNHKTRWEEIFNQIYLNEIEPFLGQGKPTIIYDYPRSQAALSQIKKSDPRFAERFEFYIAGLEIGDAYSELTDWQEQAKRFEEEQKERKRLNKVDHPTDTDFLEALKSGLPRTGGIAVGVDRLIMLFADVTDISDTMFFPIRDLI
jgi:lysyl-tRNA synthetase class 2